MTPLEVQVWIERADLPRGSATATPKTTASPDIPRAPSVPTPRRGKLSRDEGGTSAHIRSIYRVSCRRVPSGHCCLLSFTCGSASAAPGLRPRHIHPASSRSSSPPTPRPVSFGCKLNARARTFVTPSPRSARSSAPCSAPPSMSSLPGRSPSDRPTAHIKLAAHPRDRVHALHPLPLERVLGCFGSAMRGSLGRGS